MKTLNKILLTTAVTLIPLGVFAQDNFENEIGFLDESKKEHRAGKHERDNDEHREFFIQKGVNYSFEGKLQSKPAEGFNGIWVIDGIEVLVNDKTFIRQESRVIKIGDEIEIQGKRENNKITAIVLEQEDSFFN